MLIVLNNQNVIKHQISSSERFKNASIEEFYQYEFIGKGAGIHWPVLDEDMSLKGFFQNELVKHVTLT